MTVVKELLSSLAAIEARYEYMAGFCFIAIRMILLVKEMARQIRYI